MLGTISSSPILPRTGVDWIPGSVCITWEHSQQAARRGVSALQRLGHGSSARRLRRVAGWLFQAKWGQLIRFGLDRDLQQRAVFVAVAGQAAVLGLLGDEDPDLVFARHGAIVRFTR